MLQTRKQFLQSALGIGASILGLTILSCDNDTTTTTTSGVDAPPNPQGPSPNCLQNGTSSQISTNHGHILVVSKGDIAVGTDKSYDIRGAADHMHVVTITAAMFATLAANSAIMTESTLNASASFGTHSHAVMVACV